MVKSMTAFGRGESRGATLEVVVEVRSVNSKFLDLLVRLPAAYTALEERIKPVVAQRLTRGRVDVRFQLGDTAPEVGAFEVDWARARAYAEAVGRLREELGLPGELTLEWLAQVGGVLRPAEASPDLAARWPVMEEALVRALEALETMRAREGEALAADFHQRLDRIDDLRARIAQASEGQVERYAERLRTRIAELAGGQAPLDPARVAQEAAILGDRSDIAEELVRAASHIRQFRAIMAADEPAGRQLNFLLQEFNREFNTMGSKAADSAVAHMVVEAKSELEKIREQVQNIE
jgi:uncharacterized protein (TIGR00255 family)